MKTFNTAKIGDIAERFSSKAMLTAISTLCICFFLTYMSAALWFYTILVIAAFVTCMDIPLILTTQFRRNVTSDSASN
jgi:ABC-type bacteriocin/lantibiotic exporter with double-glycine peptidase domain